MLSKGSHGQKYMRLICSFLPEYPFKAGDEVDVLDGQSMWCPAYVLCIDNEQVLITHKYFGDVHDEWLPIKHVVPANTRRFKQGQMPKLNQMVITWEGRARFTGFAHVSRIIAMPSVKEKFYYSESFDHKNNRLVWAKNDFKELTRAEFYVDIKLERVKEKVKTYSAYSEEDMKHLRMIPSKKYFRKGP